MNYYFPQSPGELSKAGYPAGSMPAGMPGSQHPSLAGMAAYQQQQVQQTGRLSSGLPSGLAPGLPTASPTNIPRGNPQQLHHSASQAQAAATQRAYAGLAGHPSFVPATSASYASPYSGLYQPAGLAYSQSSLAGTYPPARPTMATLPMSSTAGAPGFYSPAAMSHASTAAMYGYSGLPGPAMYGAAPAMSSYPGQPLGSPLATSPGLNPGAAPSAAYPAGSLYSRPL